MASAADWQARPPGDGTDVADVRGEDLRNLRSRMQIIFQDPYGSLNPRMTVLEIIGEGLHLQGGFSKADIKERVAEWLRRVGLQPDHMSRYCHEFSGGQRQRIGIARALVLEPNFVVCDEPISALDVSVQAEILNLLCDLREKRDLSYLLVSHDLAVIAHMCNRIAVMSEGKLLECLTVEDLRHHRCKHPYTEQLLNASMLEPIAACPALAEPREEPSC